MSDIINNKRAFSPSSDEGFDLAAYDSEYDSDEDMSAAASALVAASSADPPVIRYTLPGPAPLTERRTCSHTKYTGTNKHGFRMYHRCCNPGQIMPADTAAFYEANPTTTLENFCVTHDKMMYLPSPHGRIDYDIGYLWRNDLHLFASDTSTTMIYADSHYNAEDRDMYHHPACKCLSNCNPLNKDVPLEWRNPGWTTSPKSGAYQPHSLYGCYIGHNLDNYQRAYNCGRWSTKPDAWWDSGDRHGIFDSDPLFDNKYAENLARMTWVPANGPPPQQYIQEVTLEV